MNFETWSSSCPCCSCRPLDPSGINVVFTRMFQLFFAAASFPVSLYFFHILPVSWVRRPRSSNIEPSCLIVNTMKKKPPEPPVYISDKLMRPGISRVFHRQRLFSKLDDLSDTPALWICGPAGTGKTTLINSYLESVNCPCFWYNVDESDHDIATLFYYLARALPGANETPDTLPLLTAEETHRLVREYLKEDLPESVLDDLHRKTDGWISGLLLMVKRGVMETDNSRLKRLKTPEAVFDYLGHMVFKTIRESHRNTLMRLSFLSAIPAEAAKTLADQSAPALLERLVKENAFTNRDTAEPPHFRFHPLFQEFLQNRAREALPPEALKQLMFASSGVMMEYGYPESAMPLYFQSGYLEDAAGQILKLAPDLIRQGRCASIGNWIDQLPPDSITNQPWLLFWKGVCSLQSAPVHAGPLFDTALSQFEKRKDPAGCFMALSGALDALTFQFDRFHGMDRYLDRYGRFQALFGDPAEPEIQIRLTSAMLNALVLRRPDSAEIETWRRNGMDILHQVKDVNLTVNIFMPLIILAIMKGDLPRAGHLLDMFSKVSHKKSTPLAYLILQDLKTFFSWSVGEFKTGFCAAEKGMAVEKETGIQLIFLGLRVHGAACAMGMSQYTVAEKLLDEIAPRLDREGIWMQGLYHLIRSWLVFLKGDAPAQRFHAMQCMEKEKSAGNPAVIAESHLGVGVMLMQHRRFDMARHHLDRSLELADHFDSRQDRFMALLFRSALGFEQQKDDAALQDLTAALELGRRQRYVYGFLWHPRQMARLCAEALKRNIETEYVRSLIRHHDLRLDIPPLDIRSWPWSVEILSLGRFSVRVNTVPVSFPRKAQKRPLSLIKYLLCSGGLDVPEHHIQDAMWPDSDGDRAHNAYTTTLHRIRKILGSRDCLLQQDGTLSFNPHRVRTDVQAFNVFYDTCTRPDKTAAAMSSQDIDARLHRLMELYGGALLPGEEHAWILPVREQLRSRFLEVLQTLGEQLEQQNKWAQAATWYQKGVDREPVLTSLHYRLIRALIRAGHPDRALRCYRAYQALSRAMPALPFSERIRNLAAGLC